jgi:hypothetical protein
VFVPKRYYAPAAPVTQVFTVLFGDVPTSRNSIFHADAVDLLAQYGITAGCAPDDFCPADNLTRAEMAVFIIRARLGATAGFSYPSTAFFSDVGPANPDFSYVQRMEVDAITSGCTPTIYCPDDSTTRSKMAVFIVRELFNQLLPANAPVITKISPRRWLPAAREHSPSRE